MEFKNGQNHAKYDVERAVQNQDGDIEWHIIGTVSSSMQITYRIMNILMCLL